MGWPAQAGNGGTRIAKAPRFGKVPLVRQLPAGRGGGHGSAMSIRLGGRATIWAFIGVVSYVQRTADSAPAPRSWLLRGHHLRHGREIVRELTPTIQPATTNPPDDHQDPHPKQKTREPTKT